MMSGDSKQDLQEFCIFTLSYGYISKALLWRDIIKFISVKTCCRHFHHTMFHFTYKLLFV